MTQEEKAKRYEEALERARKLQENSNGMILKKWLWHVFPELKESEDERIRGAIIDHLKDNNLTEWATWLEKQGEKSQYWKPSEEQLSALDYAYNSCPDTERGNYYESVLETLIDDLHKLPEKPKWTEEDEELLQHCCSAIATANYYIEGKEEMENWLKSIKKRMEE